MSSSVRSEQGTHAVRDGITYQEDIIKSPLVRKLLAVARIIIGCFFMWPFLDKLFGLGFGTPIGKGWLAGTAPAQGFIGRIENPLGGIIKPLFGNAFGDAFFMFALFGIGIAMIMGAGLRIAAIGGAILVMLMWATELPFVQTHMGPDGQMVRGATNPILDDHWLEALLLLISAATLSGDTWGVGKLWARITNGNKFLR